MTQEILTRVERKRIAVLAGGQSGEREVSFRSGEGVLEVLQRAGLDAAIVDPEPDLASQLRGGEFDIAFNALHGGAGENGCVQGVLEMAQIPYTGCGVMASAVTMNKLITKAVLRDADLPTPVSHPISSTSVDSDLALARENVGLPAVVKPCSEGSSLGVQICHSFEETDTAVRSLVSEYETILMERFVEGTEITVGVVGCGAQTRPLPVLEIVPHKEFYDYEAKYTRGMTDLICPARIPDESARRAREIALAAHQATGCHGISRCDMHLDTEGQVWVHEINSMPGLTETSDVPHEAEAEGMTYDELVLEILQSALCRDPQRA